MSESNPSSAKAPNPEKIAAVVEYVRANPGCTKRAAAGAVAKQASYGYRFVQAAIDAGLVTTTREMNKLGRPYVLTVAG